MDLNLHNKVKGGLVGALISDSDLMSLTNRDFPAVANLNEDGYPNDPGKILFSDSPETFQRRYSDATQTTILWDDFNKVLFYSARILANTKFRVYLDHVNGGYNWKDESDPKKPVLIQFPGAPTVAVNVWIGNLSQTDVASVVGSAKGAGPTGKTQIIQYLTQLEPGPPITSNITIFPNTRVIVANSPPLKPPTANHEDNYNLVWDLQANQDVEVFVTNGNVDLNNPLITPQIAGLRDHVRGVFEGWNVIKGFAADVGIDPSATNYHALRIGQIGSLATSPPTSRGGLDYTTTLSDPITNFPVAVDDKGIFGVRYEVKIPVSNSTDDPLCYGIVLNLRAEPLDGIAADIGLQTVVKNLTGMTKQDQGVIISRTTIPLAPHTRQDKHFYYMIPGGNSSPMDFVVVPFSGSGTCT